MQYYYVECTELDPSGQDGCSGVKLRSAGELSQGRQPGMSKRKAAKTLSNPRSGRRLAAPKSRLRLRNVLGHPEKASKPGCTRDDQESCHQLAGVHPKCSHHAAPAPGAAQSLEQSRSHQTGAWRQQRCDSGQGMGIRVAGGPAARQEARLISVRQCRIDTCPKGRD